MRCVPILARLFALTPRVLELGYAYLSSLSLPEVARPHLEALVAETEESCSIAVLDDDEVVYVGDVPVPRVMTVSISVGTRFPAYATSLGRALLAYQTKQRVDDYLRRVELTKLTAKTVTSKARLRKILADCRRDGFASVQDELDYGIVSVAVPVFGTDGTILAAVNCSTATTRVNKDDMVASRLPELREAANKIEVELRRYPILAHSIRSAAS